MLYHTEIGIPFNVDLPAVMNLFYSDHAKRASKNDRLGVIRLKNTITPEKAEVIEVETCDVTGDIVKVLLRHHHDVNNDICMAISLKSQVEDKFVVKTVWLNEKGDLHNTLDMSRYCRA